MSAVLLLSSIQDVTFPMPKEVAVENGSSYDIVLPETKRSTAPTPATQAPVKGMDVHSNVGCDSSLLSTPLDRPVYMKPSESVIPSDSYYHGMMYSKSYGERQQCGPEWRIAGATFHREMQSIIVC